MVNLEKRTGLKLHCGKKKEKKTVYATYTLYLKKNITCAIPF